MDDEITALHAEATELRAKISRLHGLLRELVEPMYHEECGWSQACHEHHEGPGPHAPECPMHRAAMFLALYD